MTKSKHGITDADRDLFVALSNADGVMAERIMSGDAFTWEVYQIARYRETVEAVTVAKIVKWLREQDGHGYDDVRANCIEAGEYLK